MGRWDWLWKSKYITENEGKWPVSDGGETMRSPDQVMAQTFTPRGGTVEQKRTADYAPPPKGWEPEYGETEDGRIRLLNPYGSTYDRGPDKEWTPLTEENYGDRAARLSRRESAPDSTYSKLATGGWDPDTYKTYARETGNIGDSMYMSEDAVAQSFNWLDTFLPDLSHLLGRRGGSGGSGAGGGVPFNYTGSTPQTPQLSPIQARPLADPMPYQNKVGPPPELKKLTGEGR